MTDKEFQKLRRQAKIERNKAIEKAQHDYLHKIRSIKIVQNMIVS